MCVKHKLFLLSLRLPPPSPSPPLTQNYLSLSPSDGTIQLIQIRNNSIATHFGASDYYSCWSRCVPHENNNANERREWEVTKKARAAERMAVKSIPNTELADIEVILKYAGRAQSFPIIIELLHCRTPFVRPSPFVSFSQTHTRFAIRFIQLLIRLLSTASLNASSHCSAIEL